MEIEMNNMGELNTFQLNANEYRTPMSWTITLPEKCPTGLAYVIAPKFKVKIEPSFITDIQSYNDRAVRVWFSDNTSETAVCSPDDVFSLETGITICVMKKLLGGTKEYNKLIRGALKKMEANIEAKAKAEAEKEVAKQRRLKAEKRNAARRERRNRELAEAIARAQKGDKE